MGITNTYTPADIGFLGWKGLVATGTLASGQNLVKGTVLGIVSATGLLKAYDNDASDGTQTAVGILLQDVNTGSTGLNEAFPAPVCVGFGAFKTDELTGMDANGLADLGGREVTMGGVSFTLITGGAYSLAGLASLTGGLSIGGNLAVTGTSAFTGAVTFSALATLTGGLKMAPTTGTDTAFTITASHNVVLCDDFTAPRTYALPAAATYGLGRILTVVAPSNANTHNLTLDGDSSETINGSSTRVISAAHGAVMLMAVTGGWRVLSS